MYGEFSRVKMLARHYTKILLINFQEPVTAPDLVQMAMLINTVATKIGYVIIDANSEQLGLATRDILEKLKVQYEKCRIKLSLVALKVPGADYATLAEALDAINTNESAKIMEVFAGEYKYNQLAALNTLAKTELAKSLGLPDTAPIDAIKKSFKELEKKNSQLRHIHNALSKDVKTMQRADAAPETIPTNIAKQITATKKRALEAIESSGVLR